MNDDKDKIINVEAVQTTPEPGSQALAIRNQNTAVGNALPVAEIVAQVTRVQEVMKAVMQEGEHYGTIPGCGEKKTLLQPGAQKLCLTFRLAPKYTIQETNYTGNHKEYRVVCELTHIITGQFLGEGVGCCSTLESKYRWRQQEIRCPKCGKNKIIQGKAEYGGGWLCWAKKGGCGAKFAENDPSIVNQPRGRVENPDPADCYNTVLKMAKKRAYVDATIAATAASDIFTQDIGDNEDEGNDAAPAPVSKTTEPAKTAEPEADDTPPWEDNSNPELAPEQPEQPKQQPAKVENKVDNADVPIGNKALGTFLQNCKTRFLEIIKETNSGATAWEYFRQQGFILEQVDTGIEDAPPAAIFKKPTDLMTWTEAKTAAKEEMMGHLKAMGIEYKPKPAAPTQPAAKTPAQTKPKPASKQAPPAKDGEQTVEIGIEFVSAKPGKSAKGPFTKYGIKGKDGVWYNTFDSAFGILADEIMKAGGMARITFITDNYGPKITYLAKV